MNPTAPTEFTRHATMLCAVAAIFSINARVRAAEPPKPVLKIEHFDRDPGWEGHNNHIVPKQVLMVKQDFGYSATTFAGKAAGEMGGRIQRSTTPAWYAAEVPAKTR